MTILLLILFTLLGIDLFLNMVDPSGIKAYFYDLDTLFTDAEPHATRGYILRSKVYKFWHWQATVLDDHTRLVPDTAKAHCVIAFVGDSVTFGHGVNDADTFTSQLAATAPGVQYVNAGVNGYNAAQVLATVKSYPAAGYVYLLIDNDAQPTFKPRTNVNHMPTVSLYLAALTAPRVVRANDYTVFDAAIAELKAIDNVAIVGLAGDPLAARAGVPTIQRWTHNVSRFDSHPDRTGHSEIAAQLQGYADALAVTVC